MKKLIYIPLLIVSILITSCSSDDSVDDSCLPITCLNGGVQTVDCGCACLEGYSGSNCSNKMTPTSVRITKIQVKKFPDTNNGDWWDTFPNSDADIYLILEDTEDNVIYNSLPYGYEDASGLNVTYDFVPETPIFISDVLGVHNIFLYDYDPVSDDLVSFLVFIPYDSSIQGFPTIITKTNPNNTFECDITLEYTW